MISDYMARALNLAAKGIYSTSPNPRVGCVIVKDGQIVGEGFHQQAGKAHAEINALQQAGKNAAGADVYVTLEPCCHIGKTGACTDALINAKVRRVITALQDPNPLVAGKGLAQLRAAGIITECGMLANQAHRLNKGFIKRMQYNRPYLTAKIAMSLDGKIAMQNGESKWITSQHSRHKVQQMRASSCAILSSANSMIMDNSRLNVRFDELNLPADILSLAQIRSPIRVAIDTKLRISLDSNFYRLPNALVVTCSNDHHKIKAIKDLGHQVLVLADNQNNQAEPNHQNKRINLDNLLSKLADLDCNEVLLETGSNLLASFIKANLIDEFAIFIAPKIMGSAAKSAFNLSISKLVDAYPLKITDIQSVGDDLLLTAFPAN